ncbi:hypothetical protein GGR51DRAFT_566116 [Nemania sp. FL0031]|nr:hypothetical protein GGR51DRAFT_566116 [Nemania sp. FL0031]
MGEPKVLDHGFTVLGDGGEDPVVDIVLIHGLGGHPERSWSTSAGPAPTSENHRRSPVARIGSWFRYQLRRPLGIVSAAESMTSNHPTSNSKRRESSSARPIFWPRDMLAQDFKNARILTFGYESDPRGSGQDNLYTLSKSFVARLADKRMNHSTRPIIFICHSLGGIITKFALKISRDARGAEERFGTILESTRRVIFFATPHAGSELASWGELLTRIGGVFAVTNSKLLTALNTANDNGQLEELRREFSKMLGPQLQVVNFRETKPMRRNLTTRLVVPLASAEIANKWADDRTLDADHKDICKFSGPNDEKYEDLKAVIKRCLDEISR